MYCVFRVGASPLNTFLEEPVMIRTALAVAALSIAMAGAAGAHTYEAREMHVSTTHVDFSNPRQVRELYARINAYADLVCNSDAPAEPAVAD